MKPNKARCRVVVVRKNNLLSTCIGLLFLLIAPSQVCALEINCDLSLSPHDNAVNSKTPKAALFFCQLAESKINSNLEEAKKLYKAVYSLRLTDAGRVLAGKHNIPLFNGALGFTLLQKVNSGLVFYDEDIPAFRQYDVLVTKSSLNLKKPVVPGIPIAYIAPFLGLKGETTTQNARGFDIRVKVFDAFYPIVTPEIEQIKKQVERKYHIKITGYSFKY